MYQLIRQNHTRWGGDASQCTASRGTELGEEIVLVFKAKVYKCIKMCRN